MRNQPRKVSAMSVARTKNSTNVRPINERPPLGPIRTGMRALTTVSPRLTAHLAERLFSTPRRYQRPEREHRLIATARPFRVPTRSGFVQAWRWGEGPTVLLVHGWEGRGTQLGAVIEPLLARGLSVVAYDAPAHGASAGHRVSPVDFAETLIATASWVGGVEAVVAHSMGCLVTGIAMHNGLSIERAAFIAPSLSPERATQFLAQLLDLAPSVVELVQRRLASRVGRDWDWIANGGLMQHSGVPLLIQHDHHDDDVPVSAALRLADLWTPNEVVLTEGLGHRRILWNSEVVERVAEFLSPLRNAPDHARDPWQSFLRMDLSLFDRD